MATTASRASTADPECLQPADGEYHNLCTTDDECMDVPDQQSINEALFEAARSGDLPAAFVALRRGADVNATHDIRYEAALHVAAFHGHKDVVALLLQSGADVCMASRLGRTPLHLAILSLNAHHRVEMAALLLAHGADRSIKDVNGKTGADYALEEGQFGLVDLLCQGTAGDRPALRKEEGLMRNV